MPVKAVVKDLPSARTQERKDVLKVRGGTRRGAKRRRIEWASPCEMSQPWNDPSLGTQERTRVLQPGRFR
jgi:hypothetical protein